MKRNTVLNLNISITILTLIALIAFKGFAFQYFWNSFLIDWAGIELPRIGFWYAWFISLIASWSFGKITFSSNKGGKQ